MPEPSSNFMPLFIGQPHLCLPQYTALSTPLSCKQPISVCCYRRSFVSSQSMGWPVGCSCCVGRAIRGGAAPNSTGGSQHGWGRGRQMRSYQGEPCCPHHMLFTPYIHALLSTYSTDPEICGAVALCNDLGCLTHDLGLTCYWFHLSCSNIIRASLHLLLQSLYIGYAT